MNFSEATFNFVEKTLKDIFIVDGTSILINWPDGSMSLKHSADTGKFVIMEVHDDCGIILIDVIDTLKSIFEVKGYLVRIRVIPPFIQDGNWTFRVEWSPNS